VAAAECRDPLVRLRHRSRASRLRAPGWKRPPPTTVARKPAPQRLALSPAEAPREAAVSPELPPAEAEA